MKEQIKQIKRDATFSVERALYICAQSEPREHRVAAEFLYKQYFGYLLSISLRYVRNREDAEELVNESFVRAFKKIDVFLDRDQKRANRLDGENLERVFRGWLSRICVNASIDFLRSRRLTDSLDDEEGEPSRELPVVQPSGELHVEDIRLMLVQLPDIQRTIFNLYEVEGYNHDEISHMLAIPSSTSRTYLTRAKQRLRKLYVQMHDLLGDQT